MEVKVMWVHADGPIAMKDEQWVLTKSAFGCGTARTWTSPGVLFRPSNFEG